MNKPMELLGSGLGSEHTNRYGVGFPSQGDSSTITIEQRSGLSICLLGCGLIVEFAIEFSFYIVQAWSL